MDLAGMTANLSLDSTNNTNGTQKKREGYIDWTEYFMAMAVLAAKRSKDPSCQVGACVVNKDKKIVGIGYNGMPLGCNDDEFPWGKNTPSPLDSKFLYVCHAEMNAIMNKNSADVKDCTIYVGRFPCNECAKIIIQSGIKEVVFLSEKNAHNPKNIASKRMFDAAGVEYWQYKPTHKQIVIDFNVDWNQSPSK
ncbi:deoxycytidylate deaminase-like isoform X5 [Pectinophora gossypiella]|uniref:deoxycytidylate deaminase-like isoform X5 n=1 Tax=Pectinophora gossypiella TaxID=13191 RepID=UPI00214F54B8|nr:deoxycytidylate deaminase-like isoform X5 [Pectinophora gossypiella]XP_049878444.1 deoxycytidylate deaminase-like isoform X5 [Pectinophora gossypiella]